MGINERIRLVLDRERVANKDVAEWLGITSSRLSQKFKAGIWDSVEELKKISEHTGYHLDWIVTGEGDERMESKVAESDPSYGLIKDPLIKLMLDKLNDQEKRLKELEDEREKFLVNIEKIAIARAKDILAAEKRKDASK